MKKFEKLSRAEMKEVKGGLGEPGCYTSSTRCTFLFNGAPIYGYCGIHPGSSGICWCSDQSGTEYDISSDCQVGA